MLYPLERMMWQDNYLSTPVIEEVETINFDTTLTEVKDIVTYPTIVKDINIYNSPIAYVNNRLAVLRLLQTNEKLVCTEVKEIIPILKESYNLNPEISVTDVKIDKFTSPTINKIYNTLLPPIIKGTSEKPKLTKIQKKYDKPSIYK